MANQQARPSAIRHLPVLNAPSPWMQQFIAAADPDTRLALFRTSKQLNGLVLGNSSKVRQQQNLNQDLTGVATATRLQLLAGCKEGADVKLLFDASKPTKKAGSEEAPWASLRLTNVFFFMVSSPSLPLHHVTCLELKGIICDDLVPPVVIAACPILHHIKHTHYRPWLKLKQHSFLKPIFPCPQVQRLTLCSEAPPDSNQEQVAGAELFRLQLQALPNLQDVSLAASHTGKEEDKSRIEGFWHHGIAGVQDQLTSFELHGEHDFLSLFHSEWPKLRRLLWHMGEVDSSDLEVLSQNMPLLSTLRLCSWPDVRTKHALTRALPSLKHFSIDAISIDDLPTLSLGGLASFQFSTLYLGNFDELHVPGSIENLTMCPQVGGSEGCFDLCDLRHFYSHTTPLLLAMIPLFKKLWFRHLQLPLLLLFEDGSANLFSQLPQLQVLELCSTCHEGLMHRLLPRVTALCVQARWPATLRVDSWWGSKMGPGWQQHVADAMRAAGHQHINVEVY